MFFESEATGCSNSVNAPRTHLKTISITAAIELHISINIAQKVCCHSPKSFCKMFDFGFISKLLREINKIVIILTNWILTIFEMNSFIGQISSVYMTFTQYIGLLPVTIYEDLRKIMENFPKMSYWLPQPTV